MFNRILLAFTTFECIGTIFFFSKGKRKKKDKYEEGESNKNHLLCRFVLDGIGRKIGESVAVDNDILIIKSGRKYLAIPIKHIEENEKTLLVKGLIDQEKAEEMGENWRQKSFSEIDIDEGEKDGF